MRKKAGGRGVKEQGVLRVEYAAHEPFFCERRARRARATQDQDDALVPLYWDGNSAMSPEGDAPFQCTSG